MVVLLWRPTAIGPVVLLALAACSPDPARVPSPAFESEAPAPWAGAAAPRTEREICDALTAGVDLEAREVAQGVSVELRPRQGGDLRGLRESAQELTRRFELTPRGAAAERNGRWCELFEVARQGGAAMITETPQSIRLTLTTTDAGGVEALRRHVQGFVDAARRAQPEPE